MARHYAHVINGVVDRVCVFDDTVDSYTNPEHPVGEWIECFMEATPSNGYNFPAPGWSYNDEDHAFYDSRQPYPNWTLNTTTYLWDAPVERPADHLIPDSEGNVKKYKWDVETNNWTFVTFKITT
jgi:hypothetical protein